MNKTRAFILLFNLFSILTVRVNIGGSLMMNNVVIDMFKEKSVGVITAAGSRGDATELMREMNRRGAKAEWIPIQQPCRNLVRDPNIIKLIEKYDYIYFTGIYFNNKNYL